MKNKKIVFLIATLFVFMFSGIAQTKPKPKTQIKSKTQAKATEKKPVKAYICSNKKDKFFHKYSSCKQLNSCAGEIKCITSGAELKKFKRKSCQHCYNL